MGARLTDFRILVAPGLHGSGDGHWQTRWEDLHPAFERIEQWHWDRPDLHAWSAQVGHVLRRSRRPAVVVAHSFGCLATLHRAASMPANLAAVLLVAPADPRKFGYERELAEVRLAIPSIVIGSQDDPWMPADRARTWAAWWGAQFVNAGALGHINAESGLGAWPAGLAMLERLVHGLRPASPCRCTPLAAECHTQQHKVIHLPPVQNK
jgi:predicted alpha/beta hydrolase family esterase